MVKKWIQGAIKRKGALTAAAKKAGGVKNGKITKAFLNKAAKSKTPTLRKRAVLAKTLSKTKKK